MYEYLKNIYKSYIDLFFDPQMTVLGTINTQGEDITHESSYDLGIGDDTGMFADPVLSDYPNDLQPNYRVLFLPIDKSGLTLKDGTKITYGIAGQFEPFDLWVACKTSDVNTSFDKTVIDHAASIEIRGQKYRVRGQIPDYFGDEEIMYVFLERM